MHLAIIMDGNGRWSEKNGLSRINGHKAGSETLTEIALYCVQKEIDYLTVYAFSVQNWGRPKEEINALFFLIKLYFGDIDLFVRANIRIKIQGYIDIYPAEILDVLKNAIRVTRKNTGMVLTIALSYGGQEEIAEAVNRIIQDGHTSISTKTITAYIEPDKTPNPDLVIRTSGEYRVSNFLLWQSAYSEYLFLDIFWPEFTEAHIDMAIEIYAKRSRRFGLTKAVLPAAEKKSKYNLPDEAACQARILDLLFPNNKMIPQVETRPDTLDAELLYVNRYKNNTILRDKYFNSIQMLLQATNEKTNTVIDLAESITKEIIIFVKKIGTNATQTDDFYRNIYDWYEFVFFLEIMIQNKKSDINYTLFLRDFESSDFVTIIDIHKLFTKHILFSEEEGDKFKKLLIKLDNPDISLYKCLIYQVLHGQVQEQEQGYDPISAVLQMLYIFFPIMQDLQLNMERMCLLSTALTLLLHQENNTNAMKDADILYGLNKIIESIETNNLQFITDNTITKIKTAVVYLILFRLKNKNKNKMKITFHTLFKYINMLL